MYLCLFASQGHDLRHLLRDAGASDEQLSGAIAEVWAAATTATPNSAAAASRSPAAASARSRCTTSEDEACKRVKTSPA